MFPEPTRILNIEAKSWLRPLMGAMSIFTMAMTVPQVLLVWLGVVVHG
ncbi:MAG TPA: hypothetical protein VL754_15055 [Verrucomicrobiae bacterium]|jgi:hypothetical protein|nr:hypothetical protein [Verrucomicrobiae bacterium]